MSAAIPIDRVQTASLAAARFLCSLFNGQETGIAVLFSKPSMSSNFAHLDRGDWYVEAAETAMYLREEQNVYLVQFRAHRGFRRSRIGSRIVCSYNV